MSQISRDILSDITVHMKYAKYIPELNRRETWHELVTRNKEMHIKKYPDLEGEINEANEYEYDKSSLSSSDDAEASNDTDAVVVSESPSWGTCHN